MPRSYRTTSFSWYYSTILREAIFNGKGFASQKLRKSFHKFEKKHALNYKACLTFGFYKACLSIVLLAFEVVK